MHALPCLSLRGSAVIPGDKSISHRALMIASQVPGDTTVTGLLEGEDVLATAGALRALGVAVEQLEPGKWCVSGRGAGSLSEPSETLDLGNAGTGARLLIGLVASYPFTTFFSGDTSLCSRPMKRVMTPLEQMGGSFVARSGNRLPLALIGAQPPLPITYHIPVPSAQVKSAILLAALNIAGETTVVESQATRDHTERMLQHLGFALTTENADKDGSTTIRLCGQQELPIRERTISVPGDPSSAAFPIIAALLVPESEVTLFNICMNPLRTGLFHTLQEMGARIIFGHERIIGGEPVADITIKHSSLNSVVVPAERAPSMIDEYPILAVAAAFAKGETVMQGLSELRVKESDRLQAIADGLSACGVQARIDGDDLIVKGTGGSVQGGAVIEARHDHRIAMSFLVLGLAAKEPVEIDDSSSIATSFPHFDNFMNKLGADIRHSQQARQNPLRRTGDVPPMIITIDGPAASGKGTLARRLAERFGFAYLDTGSLYRAVAMKLVYADKNPYDEQAAIEAAYSIEDQDLSNPRLRQERIGQVASVVSAIPEVRDALLNYQRNFAKRREGTVLDGRDTGTVVCPDADLKFFMMADVEARARRRWRQLQGQGIEVVYDSVLKDLRERDTRDSQRNIAPLTAAKDALTIDSSQLSASDVFERVLDVIRKKISSAG